MLIYGDNSREGFMKCLEEIYGYIGNMLGGERDTDKSVGIIAVEFDGDLIKTRIASRNVDAARFAFILVSILKSMGELETLKQTLSFADELEKVHGNLLDYEDDFKMLWGFAKLSISMSNGRSDAKS